jgi:hypothetical protein
MFKVACHIWLPGAKLTQPRLRCCHFLYAFLVKVVRLHQVCDQKLCMHFSFIHSCEYILIRTLSGICKSWLVILFMLIRCLPHHAFFVATSHPWPRWGQTGNQSCLTHRYIITPEIVSCQLYACWSTLNPIKYSARLCVIQITSVLN